ncbi:GM13840 [Drosophila sechellia]|uniref:GM13840 n=1 Tax=Drosophila sechellia TaxID=7238 RepID=B4HUU4_DROSE|nr:GM13840 [Drosophila sechellia]
MEPCAIILGHLSDLRRTLQNSTRLHQEKRQLLQQKQLLQQQPQQRCSIKSRSSNIACQKVQLDRQPGMEGGERVCEGKGQVAVLPIVGVTPPQSPKLPACEHVSLEDWSAQVSWLYVGPLFPLTKGKARPKPKSLTLIDGTHDAAGELPPKATGSHCDPPPISASSDDKFKLGMPWPSTQIHRDLQGGGGGWAAT